MNKCAKVAAPAALCVSRCRYDTRHERTHTWGRKKYTYEQLCRMLCVTRAMLRLILSQLAVVVVGTRAVDAVVAIAAAAASADANM